MRGVASYRTSPFYGKYFLQKKNLGGEDAFGAFFLAVHSYFSPSLFLLLSRSFILST